MFRQQTIDPRGCSAGACRVDQQWGEPLHPAVDGDMINRDATLSQQLLHIAVRETITQVPAHRDHDHISWKSEPSKARGNKDRRRLASSGSCVLRRKRIDQRTALAAAIRPAALR